MRGIFITCIFLALNACGGGPNLDKEAADRIPENQRVGQLKAEILQGQPIFSNGTLEGSGLVRFAEPLLESNSANNFTLSIELQVGSSATLITNAGRELAGGIEVEISHNSALSSPHVVARAGSDVLDISTFFTSVSAASPMMLSFDLHNDHANAVHLVAWNNLGASTPLGEDQIRGLGTGVFWGLRLNNGKITGAEKAGPRDQH